MPISESLIISIVLAGTGLISYTLRLMFLSKCNICKCFCIEVHRRTKEEQQTVSNRNINNITHPITESMNDIENK
jgi:hypothetical protein